MAKNIIAVDIGNTNTSVGLVDTKKLICKKSYTFSSHDVMEKTLNCIKQIQAEYSTLDIFTVKICTVIKSIQKDLSKALSSREYISAVSFVTYSKNLPVTIHYNNPNTMGTDRISNVLYGINKYPKQNVIIIDAGTAITIDMVSPDKEFIGGFILPGVMTQLKSLHDNTSELPLVEWDTNLTTLSPKSTNASIVSGVYFEIAGGISFIINKLRKKYPENKRILTCGGWWGKIDSYIEFECEFIPKLTLIGTGLYEE